jgi:hypothetical protein
MSETSRFQNGADIASPIRYLDADSESSCERRRFERQLSEDTKSSATDWGDRVGLVQQLAALSNCLESQVMDGAGADCQGVLDRTIALRIVRSFRMQATMATLGALPFVISR